MYTGILIFLFMSLVTVLATTLWRLLPTGTRRCICIIVAGTVATALLLAIGFAGANALADQLRSGFVYQIVEDEVVVLDAVGGGLDWHYTFEDPDEVVELEEYCEVIFVLKSSGDPSTILDDKVQYPTYSSTKVDRAWADDIIAQYKRKW